MAPGRRTARAPQTAPDDFVLVRLGLLRAPDEDPADPADAAAPTSARDDPQRHPVSPVPPATAPARAPGPPPLFEPGTVLARRYRLLHDVPTPSGSGTVLWRAVDEVLARPVAVKVLPARERRSVEFLEAAARAGAVECRSLARVYDAAVEPRPTRPSVAYVISEWVPARALDELLADGPLPVEQALDLAVQAAEALCVVHAAGVVHARLHPGNVLVDDASRLRVCDTAVAAAVHGVPERDGQAGDVRDLAAVLYALLTARWPTVATPQPAGGLAAAPTRGGELLRPAQVRGGVQRALDTLVLRALQPERVPDQPPLRTAAALLAELRALRGAAALPRPALPPLPRRAPRRRLAALAAGLLVLAGSAGWAYAMGEDPAAPPPRTTEAASTSSGVPRPVAVRRPAPLDMSRAVVQDFDPYGSPPREQRETVGLATDGDRSTAWSTERYRSAALGGIKPGVGLLVDLGTARALSRVELDVTPGAALELRAGDVLGSDETSLPVVARDRGSPGRSTLVPSTRLSARYWLVWVTRLPADDGRFRAGVEELVLRPAR